MNLKSEIDKLIYYYSYHTTLVLEMNAASNYFWSIQLAQIKNIESNENYISIKDRKPDKFDKLGFNIFEKAELIEEHTPKMSLIYLFSLFEAFNKDFFQTLFKFKPELMKTKDKNLNYETLLQFSNIDELYECIIQEEINNLGYLNIDQIREMLMKKFKINLEEEFKYWKQLRENYYRRNIIVHNDGKISNTYLRKLELPDEEINKELSCDSVYLHECCRNIQSYIDFISDSIRKKFKLADLLEG